MTHSRGLHYDRAVQEAGLGHSHLWLIERVPPGSTVLDCGCAGGYVAVALANKGCIVDGVELDGAAADSARSVCRDVFVGSLEDEDFLRSLPAAYDRILLGDVLEHLGDPVRALRRLSAHLGPGGRVLASLPNVANWSVRLHLLRGRFDYEDYGLLDRTHLRFFTYETARQLAHEAGLRVHAHEHTPLPLPTRRPGEVILQRLRRWRPNLFAYQTLLEMQPLQDRR